MITTQEFIEISKEIDAALTENRDYFDDLASRLAGPHTTVNLIIPVVFAEVWKVLFKHVEDVEH